MFEVSQSNVISNGYSIFISLSFSEVIRNDTLKSQRHTVSKECRQQIRAQLFQQRENIDFDPKLKSACRNEINKMCKDVPHGAGQVNTKNASSFKWSAQRTLTYPVQLVPT